MESKMTITELTRTWSKTTSTGKIVTVTITMDDHGRQDATADVDGKAHRLSTCDGLKLIRPQTQSGITCIAAMNLIGLGKLGLTAAEYASFKAVLAEQEAAMAANPTLPVRVTNRKELAASLSDAIRAASYGASRRFDRYDTGYCSTAKEDAAIAKAEAALNAFDLAHPEVLAEIKRATEESVAHFLAVD